MPPVTPLDAIIRTLRDHGLNAEADRILTTLASVMNPASEVKQ